jgi:hypothetical protein
VPPRRRRDLDLDSSAYPSAIPLDAPPEAYLRVAANPFLALFAVLFALAASDGLWSSQPFDGDTRMALVVAVWLSLLVAFPWLVQFHCLDCGATGRLKRWRGHLCPRVAERRLLRKPRRVRGPTPSIQIVIWLWVFALTAVVVMSIRGRF